MITELPEWLPHELFVGGRWQPAAGGATFAVEDPGTGVDLAHVADAGPAEALAAASAAARAQDGWAATAPRERAELLRRSFDALTARRREFATVITAEMGKPLAEAEAEVDYAAEFLRWFAEQAAVIAGSYLPSPDGRGRILVSKGPVGPCLLVTPWNFPLAMATRKIAPALAAGCASVLKPAELTPLTSLLFAQLLHECGLPAGVVNVLPTTTPGPVVEALLGSGVFRKLSFTGSTAVGRLLLEQCGRRILRTSMELGGNAPFVVFDDADLDVAVEAALVAKMRNTGQACTAANRFYVHRNVAEEFSQRLSVRLGELTVGHGMLPASQVGPVITAAAAGKVHALVEEAAHRGARVLTGGEPVAGPGHFYRPTLLADVPPGARVIREEIFGPVAPLMTFDEEEQAIAWANDTEYGLTAYVFTRQMERALRVADRLEVGMVALNTGTVSNVAAPFGGVKASGLGREGGFAGIEEYIENKYLAVP